MKTTLLAAAAPVSALPFVSPLAPARDLPPGARILLVQGSSATSHRLRGAPNAWHRITVNDGVPEVAARIWLEGGWRDAPAA